MQTYTLALILVYIIYTDRQNIMTACRWKFDSYMHHVRWCSDFFPIKKLSFVRNTSEICVLHIYRRSNRLQWLWTRYDCGCQKDRLQNFLFFSYMNISRLTRIASKPREKKLAKTIFFFENCLCTIEVSQAGLHSLFWTTDAI